MILLFMDPGTLIGSGTVIDFGVFWEFGTIIPVVLLFYIESRIAGTCILYNIDIRKTKITIQSLYLENQ